MTSIYSPEKLGKLVNELQKLGIRLDSVRTEGRIIFAVTFKHHVEALRSYASIHDCTPLSVGAEDSPDTEMRKYLCEVAFSMNDPITAVPNIDSGRDLTTIRLIDEMNKANSQE